MKTAGMWPWKLETFKECVTTHLPNGSALKMDGAKCPILYSTGKPYSNPIYLG